MSEGGACLELAERLEPQTHLRLRVQSEEAAIDVEARVVWAGLSDLPGGVLHGVAFTRITPGHLENLRALLGAPRLDRRAGTRLPLDLPVTCHPSGQAGASLEGRTGDLSRDGLLLFLPDVLSPGDALEVTLHTSAGPLTIVGKIVWVDPLELWTRGEPVAHGFQVTSPGWSVSVALTLPDESLVKGLQRLVFPESKLPAR